jgi:hypothetical protein
MDDQLMAGDQLIESEDQLSADQLMEAGDQLMESDDQLTGGSVLPGVAQEDVVARLSPCDVVHQLMRDVGRQLIGLGLPLTGDYELMKWVVGRTKGLNFGHSDKLAPLRHLLLRLTMKI